MPRSAAAPAGGQLALFRPHRSPAIAHLSGRTSRLEKDMGCGPTDPCERASEALRRLPDQGQQETGTPLNGEATGFGQKTP